jgi:hypothetical protein
MKMMNLLFGSLLLCSSLSSFADIIIAKGDQIVLETTMLNNIPINADAIDFDCGETQQLSISWGELKNQTRYDRHINSGIKYTFSLVTMGDGYYTFLNTDKTSILIQFVLANPGNISLEQVKTYLKTCKKLKYVEFNPSGLSESVSVR